MPQEKSATRCPIRILRQRTPNSFRRYHLLLMKSCCNFKPLPLSSQFVFLRDFFTKRLRKIVGNMLPDQIIIPIDPHPLRRYRPFSRESCSDFKPLPLLSPFIVLIDSFAKYLRNRRPHVAIKEYYTTRQPTPPYPVTVDGYRNFKPLSLFSRESAIRWPIRISHYSTPIFLHRISASFNAKMPQIPIVAAFQPIRFSTRIFHWTSQKNVSK